MTSKKRMVNKREISSQLVQKIQAGDAQAFNKLVELWYNRIYQFALKMGGGHDGASEIAQKTFIQTYKHLGRLQDPERFASWLYRIAGNCWMEEHRKESRRRSESLDEASLNTDTLGARKEDSPEEVYHQEELSQLIRQALSRIPAEQRLVILLKTYEGLKFSEIAETLTIPENTAKSRLYYGLKALAKIFDQWQIPRQHLLY